MREFSFSEFEDMFTKCRHNPRYVVGIFFADGHKIIDIFKKIDAAKIYNRLPATRYADRILFPNGSEIHFVVFNPAVRNYEWNEILYDKDIPWSELEPALKYETVPYVKFDFRPQREINFSAIGEFNIKLLSKLLGIQPDPQPEVLDAALDEFLSGIKPAKNH